MRAGGGLEANLRVDNNVHVVLYYGIESQNNRSSLPE